MRLYKLFSDRLWRFWVEVSHWNYGCLVMEPKFGYPNADDNEENEQPRKQTTIVPWKWTSTTQKDRPANNWRQRPHWSMASYDQRSWKKNRAINVVFTVEPPRFYHRPSDRPTITGGGAYSRRHTTFWAFFDQRPPLGSRRPSGATTSLDRFFDWVAVINLQSQPMVPILVYCLL